jgi:hypothetical protein
MPYFDSVDYPDKDVGHEVVEIEVDPDCRLRLDVLKQDMLKKEEKKVSEDVGDEGPEGSWKEADGFVNQYKKRATGRKSLAKPRQRVLEFVP